MPRITPQLFPATFSLPAATQLQVSRDGSLCFERSCEEKNQQLGKSEKSPIQGLSPAHANIESRAWFAESSGLARSGRHRQTLKHLLHMAQVQRDTRNSPAMQRTDLQNERPLASNLLVHSRCPFSQNMLPAVAWTHPPHTGSGAEMQSENPGRDSASQLCCRENGSHPSKEMLPSVKKINEILTVVLRRNFVSFGSCSKPPLRDWAGWLLASNEPELPVLYILYEQQLISELWVSPNSVAILEYHGLSFEGS